MDSLTQIILGASVGEAVLGKKVGNKAMLYGAIAGTIPDLDTFVGNFTDVVTAIEVHRGFSHSIIFAVLFAPIFGFLISKIERKSAVDWQDWSWLMFWGLFTHPILDSFTTWGTQLFWPLDLKLAFKTIFVIDPLYTVPFLIFVILAMRQKRASPKRRMYNNLGLIISSGYLLLTVIFKGMAYSKFVENLDKQGYFYEKIETKPAPFNTILWTANVEVEDAFLIGDYSFFDSKPIQFSPHPKNHEALGNLSEEDKVQRLIKITQGWYTVAEREDGFYLTVLRFGMMSVDPKSEEFAFSFLIEKNENGVTITENEKDARDAKKLFSDLWTRIKGN